MAAAMAAPAGAGLGPPGGPAEEPEPAYDDEGGAAWYALAAATGADEDSAEEEDDGDAEGLDDEDQQPEMAEASVEAAAAAPQLSEDPYLDQVQPDLAGKVAEPGQQLPPPVPQQSPVQGPAGEAPEKRALEAAPPAPGPAAACAAAQAAEGEAPSGPPEKRAKLELTKADPEAQVASSAVAGNRPKVEAEPPVVVLEEDEPAVKTKVEKSEEGEGGEDMEGEEDMPWDEKVVVVRQGQVFIELQHMNPPMQDADLLRFCDWLDQQMPLVVQNFPYVRKSGAYVDLSDNAIGPDGLDKLFRVLRDHRVPCVVMKAYRNCLDDAIVDTLIEYLYTQPESFPMHGIHISHNKISDKGALRLIRASAQCGHYPRLTSRLPLWLRLECNEIQDPQRLVAESNSEGFNVCLMGDGMCSRPNCNHYSGVHVQLPYFFHQHNQGLRGSLPWQPPQAPQWIQPKIPPPEMPPPMPPAVPAEALPAMLQEAPGDPMASVGGCGGGLCELGDAPDWQRQGPYGAARPAPRRVSPSERPPAPPAVPMALANGYDQGASWGGGGGGWSGKGTGAWGGGWGDKGASKGGWGKGGSSKGGGGKGGGFKGKGGGNYNKQQMWVGVALVNKAKQDVRLMEGEAAGFSWHFIGEGRCPQITSVEPGSQASMAVMPGQSLLRVNGLDTSIFSERQVTDMLKQRPVSLRFGDQ